MVVEAEQLQVKLLYSGYLCIYKTVKKQYKNSKYLEILGSRNSPILFPQIRLLKKIFIIFIWVYNPEDFLEKIMYQWNEFEIKLPSEIPSDIFYVKCPDCNVSNNTNTLKVYHSHNSWYCAKCGYTGNLEVGVQQDKTSLNNKTTNHSEEILSFKHHPITDKDFKILSSLKISKDTLNHFQVSTGKEYFELTDKFEPVLKFPHIKNKEIVGITYNRLEKTENGLNTKQQSATIGSEHTCFNYDGISNEHTYIVQTPLEVLAFHEAGIHNVISFFGGNNISGKFEDKDSREWFGFFEENERKLNNVKKFTLAFSNTEFSAGLQDECIRRLGKEKCWLVQPPETDYNWLQVFSEYGKKKLGILLETAKAIPVRGIFNLSDVEDRIDNLYDNGLRSGYSTGFPSLDPFYKVVPGQWTVMTGIPGHGKSNFLDAVMVNLAKFSDLNFGIFSPENQPIERHFAGIIEKFHRKPFDKNKKDRMTREEMEMGKRWVDKHFSVILPHEDDDWHIQGVLALAKTLVFRKGIKGLVIDPWNELDHSRPAGQTETEYVSFVLTEIRKFARQYDVHVWVVAHPAKLYKNSDGEYPIPTPYDIAGSAHFRNKADNAVTVWRHVGFDDQDIVDIHVQKVRFKEVGQVGMVSLRFDMAKNSLMDDIDQLKRAEALAQKKVLSSIECRLPVALNAL